MTRFLFVPRVPTEYVPGHPENVARWKAWSELLRDRRVEPGNAALAGSTRGDVGPGTRVGGYLIVEADDLEEALTIATSCPAIELGGGVEVNPMTDS